MLLTPKQLENIKSYDVSSRFDIDGQPLDVIVIHWKQWWKPRSIYRWWQWVTDRKYHSLSDSWRLVREPTPAFKSLRDQLHKHFHNTET